MTALSLRVLSSTTTIADSWSRALQTENQTSSPALLYSGCVIRFAPSDTPAHSPMGSTSGGASRLSRSNTATDWAIFGSGLSGVDRKSVVEGKWGECG